MNKINFPLRATLSSLVIGGASLLLAACAAETFRDPGASTARVALTDLESNPNLASRAPVAIHDAETAVHDAEQPQTDQAVASHLTYLATRRVQIAATLAQTSYAEDQHKVIADRNSQMQLNARTNEADTAKQKNDDLEAQLAALQAKKTDRGMVLTLGDVLFSTGRADLKPGGIANLDRLATFLDQAPDRTVRIEGHTDNVGSQELNQALSQRRADSVEAYLAGRGVAATRMRSIGESENSPIADNNTEAGRQANRRVEVIIQNSPQVGSTQ
jgi:outer membrane protein OmpA-like peptidoglycan-associated protein